MKTISIQKILFLSISFGFLIINFLIAWIPNNMISLLLIAIRDSWVIVFSILLIYKKENELLLSLLLFLVLGFIPIFWSEYSFNPITFFYGLRDIYLFVLILYLVKNPIRISEKSYKQIFIIILGLASFQLMSQVLGFNNLIDSIFQTRNYYDNKGITSNTSGGIFGERITVPLYSSSLLGTFLAFMYFKSNRIIKIVCAIIGFFTLSKAIILIPILYIFKRVYKTFLIGFVSGLVILRNFIDVYIENSEPSIITFHLGSIRDRFYSIDMLSEKIPMFEPDILGTNSIAAKSFLGLDPSTAPESLIIARVLDFNLFIIAPTILLIYYIQTQLTQKEKFYISVVLFLFFFSNLSNHPIAFLPLITTWTKEKLQ